MDVRRLQDQSFGLGQLLGSKRQCLLKRRTSAANMITQKIEISRQLIKLYTGVLGVEEVLQRPKELMLSKVEEVCIALQCRNFVEGLLLIFM
jgi:hypothetical protein